MRCGRAMGLGLALVLLCAVGCGRAGTAPTLKVTGTITYNGTPVSDANVAFTPENGRPAVGVTDASGNFTLSTFDPGDGAVPGKHTVTVTDAGTAPAAAGEEDYSMPDESAGRFPAKYADPAESGFTATVEKGKENDFTFDMTDD